MLTYAWLIPALPALAFASILLFTRSFRALSAGLALAAASASFLLSLGAWKAFLDLGPGVRAVPAVSVPWIEVAPFSVSVGVLVDPLSLVLLFVVTSVALLVQVYSLGYLKDDPNLPAYYAYLSLFTASMLGLVLAPNYLQMFLCWELVGLCSYLLIGFWYRKPEAAAAAQKAFVTTRFGDVGFLLGVITVGMVFQTFDFALVEGVVEQGVADGSLKSTFVAGIALLLFCGAVGKSGQFPLHVWLPDAMEGPTPVSALIHAATMVVAGVYLVARTFLLFQADPLAASVVAWVGGFTALFAATIAVAQTDIKRILAYSTLSQIGFMMLALGCGGLTAGMFHLTTHAFFKALLFLGAGSVIHAVHTNDIGRMGGLLRSMPSTGITFLVASLAIAGVPPLAGFWSKDEILTAVHASGVPGHEILFVLASVTAYLTAFYMFRLFFRVFTGAEKTRSHESPAVMTIPLWILAALSAVAGLVNAPGVGAFTAFLEGPGAAHAFHASTAALSTLLAAAGITTAALFYWKPRFSAAAVAERFRPLHRLLENKYYVDEFYSLLSRYVLFALGTACAVFDRRLVDGGMVDGSGWITRKAGAWIRLVQTGGVHFYGLVTFAAAAGAALILSLG